MNHPLSTFLLALLLGSASPLFAQFSPLQDTELPRGVEPVIAAVEFRGLDLDAAALRAFVERIPAQDAGSEVTMSFPMPDGTGRTFRVAEDRVMAEALQQRFPSIRTFSGVAADGRGGTVHFDWTPRGFHAMVLTPGEETVFIDPVDRDGASGQYMAYTRSAFYAATAKFRPTCDARRFGAPEDVAPTCGKLLRMGLDLRPAGHTRAVAPQAANTPNGSELRTYRLALACTGEYASYHGGTVAGALSAMATSLVRINGVYQRDVAIRMELVANNDAVIYLNASTDPYTNNDGGAMLSQNQTACDAQIGFANYDIGHVFSTGGGGVAYLQSPCSSIKAGGVTGGANPVGDPFDIDYVCHEMGHQFGANHTQNNSCNRAASAAYEPGSASTIMGYAGICSPNLQSNSDDHFHNHSYNEMVSFSVNGGGNTCAVVTPSGNTPPTVDAGPSGKTLPHSTPFELTAVAGDVDGTGTLTYNWEQYDLGPATASGDNNLTNPSGNQPIFRSWPSSTSPTRVFPRIEDLVAGTTVIGEHLPDYGRDMSFKCTVRDNSPTGGVADDLIEMTVDGATGPFQLISPNGIVAYTAGEPASVIWDVANTDAPPVSCAAVDIYLSTDGGYTWPYLLASDEPNDGAATVVFPNLPTSSARVKVKAADNFFFDISNLDFTVEAAVDPVAIDAWVSGVTDGTGELCGDAINPTATIANLGETTLTAFDVTFAVDGGASEVTVNWTGSLPYLASVDVSACSGGACLAAPTGLHTLDVDVALTGGLVDENPDNDAAASAFETGCFDGCTACGCTDETACNYSAAATLDDGSCTYPLPGLECDCASELSVNQSLAGGASTDLSLQATGTLETLDVTFQFTTNGSSWPGDMVLGICTPTGTCIQIGGYDVDFGYTDAGSWPNAWGGTTAGTYTAAIDLTDLDLTGEGEWTVSVMNGWTSSSDVAYDVVIVANGLCELGVVPGCTDEAACNYAVDATVDDGSCTYAEEFLTCGGDCINDGDSDGVCDELEIPGCTDPEGCNYDAAATDSAACTYPEPGYDCAGNPLSTCPEDLNGNGLVEIQDILILLGDFGCSTPPCTGDLTDDGVTSVADMLAMLSVFGTNCW